MSRLSIVDTWVNVKTSISPVLLEVLPKILDVAISGNFASVTAWSATLKAPLLLSYVIGADALRDDKVI